VHRRGDPHARDKSDTEAPHVLPELNPLKTVRI
jgi:hypothetical protein